MGEYNNIDWEKANYRRALRPKPVNKKPNIDVVVSKIVGKPVSKTDPRLIQIVNKWNDSKTHNGDEKPDNHLSNPNKIKDLKRLFNKKIC